MTRGRGGEYNCLVWERKNRNVFERYEALEKLGEGSISIVDKVKKRTVGGSARKGRYDFESPRRGKRSFCPLFPRFGCNSRRSSSATSSASSCCASSTSSSLTEATSTSISRGGASICRRGCDEGSWKVGVAQQPAPEPPRPLFRALKSACVYGKSRALKNLQEIGNEIDILKQLDHPNIVKAYETHSFRHNFVSIVLELCTGGTLLTTRDNHYSEEEVASIVAQVLSAVAHLHGKGIIHRDLKYENIMWESSESNAEVRISDFGLAVQRKKKTKLVHPRRAGTIYTMAPEVLSNQAFNEKADIWSVGVITYMLLSGGKMPFQNTERGTVSMQKIVAGDFALEGDGWKKVSDDAKNFVRCLLELKPDSRPSARDAQNHQWLLSHRRPSMVPTRLAVETLLSRWMKFSQCSAMQKIALMVIAHQSTADQLTDLRAMFHYVDGSGNGSGCDSRDGMLTRTKFKNAISNMFWNDAAGTFSDEDLDQMFDAMDFYGRGIVEYTQFIAATLDPKQIEEWRLAEAFDRLDCDGCGFITSKNVLKMFKCCRLRKTIQKEVSTPNNGGIRQHGLQYAEFQQLFLRS